MNGISCQNAPWRITFETNPDRCNLHCIMCDTHSIYLDNKKNRDGKKERLLPFYILEKVIRSAAGKGLREVIPSTMGEPLLYPEMEQLLSLLSELNLKLNLTTNGTFPLCGAGKWGDLILPIASDVKISMNGATQKTAESIMRGLNYEKQLENAQIFINKRDHFRTLGYTPNVTMQATFMRSNILELPEMLEKAIEMGFDRFKGHHVWITNPHISDETLRIPKYREQWNDTVAELKKIAGSKIALANVLPFEDSNNSFSDTICPFLGKEAWIGANGDFNVCCAPSQEREVFGTFGNVYETDFMDLWHSDCYKKFVSGWGQYDLCNHCNMRISGSENI